MIADRLKKTLQRLRAVLSGKAEEAYRERDDAKEQSDAETYAAGEAHAYGIASDEVRKAQQEQDPRN